MGSIQNFAKPPGSSYMNVHRFLSFVGIIKETNRNSLNTSGIALIFEFKITEFIGSNFASCIYMHIGRYDERTSGLLSTKEKPFSSPIVRYRSKSSGVIYSTTCMWLSVGARYCRMVITLQPTERRSFITWNTSSSVSPNPSIMPDLAIYSRRSNQAKDFKAGVIFASPLRIFGVSLFERFPCVRNHFGAASNFLDKFSAFP